MDGGICPAVGHQPGLNNNNNKIPKYFHEITNGRLVTLKSTVFATLTTIYQYYKTNVIPNRE